MPNGTFRIDRSRARRNAPDLHRLATLAFAVVTTACGGSDAQTGENPSERTPVEATTAWRDTVSVRVSSVGSLEADAIVQLKSETEGTVVGIPISEGKRVRAGQVLVQLDPREARARYEAAQATLRRAQAEAENLRARLKRNDDLLAEGAISQQTYDDLETSYDLAVARVEEAEANLAVSARDLQKTTIRAPFSGTVGKRAFYIGDLIQVGAPLFTLVDNDTLKVEFSVPERYGAQLEPGSRTTIRVASLPGQTFVGTVTFVSPVVEPASRTVTVKSVVPNPAGALKAGQFADVEIALEQRPDAVVVPETAIVPRSGENFAFVVRHGVATRQGVRLGERSLGIVEVTSGVQVGDTVVIAGQQRIQDGSPVSASITPPEAWRDRLIRTPGGE